MLCCTLHALVNDGGGLTPRRRRTEGCHDFLYSYWGLTGVTAMLLFARLVFLAGGSRLIFSAVVAGTKGSSSSNANK